MKGTIDPMPTATVRVYLYTSNDGRTTGVFGSRAEAVDFQRTEDVPAVEIELDTYLDEFVITAEVAD